MRTQFTRVLFLMLYESFSRKEHTSSIFEYRFLTLMNAVCMYGCHTLMFVYECSICGCGLLPRRHRRAAGSAQQFFDCHVEPSWYVTLPCLSYPRWPFSSSSRAHRYLRLGTCMMTDMFLRMAGGSEVTFYNVSYWPSNSPSTVRWVQVGFRYGIIMTVQGRSNRTRAFKSNICTEHLLMHVMNQGCCCTLC